jgi:hypothetical protein
MRKKSSMGQSSVPAGVALRTVLPPPRSRWLDNASLAGANEDVCFVHSGNVAAGTGMAEWTDVGIVRYAGSNGSISGAFTGAAVGAILGSHVKGWRTQNW